MMTMTIAKPSTANAKTKLKNAQIIDSKPTQLAKIMYAAIVRYTKAKNARNRDKNANFALDAERRRSYVVDRNN